MGGGGGKCMRLNYVLKRDSSKKMQGSSLDEGEGGSFSSFHIISGPREERWGWRWGCGWWCGVEGEGEA